MIRRRGPLSPGEAEIEAPLPSPAEGDRARAGFAFATLWATGPDPRRDHVFRAQALRRNAAGGWETFDRWCRAPREAEGEAHASARMRRDFGVDASDLVAAAPPEEVAGELAAFLGERTALVPDRARFRAWIGGNGRELPFAVADLAGLAALLRPGRLAAAGEGLAARLLGAAGPLARHPLAIGPAEVHASLGRLVGAFLEADVAALALAAHGYARAEAGLRRVAPGAAAELALALDLAERPSRWRDGPDGLFSPHPALTDGRLSDATRAYRSLETAAAAARPAWVRAAEDAHGESLRASLEEEAALAEPDLRLLDEIFQVHLPRLFAERGEGEGGYRAGQHATAREVAAALGRRELLLVHAPTGTGKTLAYLVPSLLWALRNETRIGVATFTRALQEQAMDRDVPLARELLRRAGVAADPETLRATALKGRANYLCWRALSLQIPLPGLPPLDQLAWTELALFALGEPDGDLDRFPRRSPLAGIAPADWSAAIDSLVRLVRADSECCTRPEDRATCGAEAARRRAMGAHVVVTNHAFAIASREMFRHLVFDECEHLHDVAHGAFSHFVELRELGRLLARFREGGSRRHGPLDRVAEVAADGSPAGQCTHGCLEAQERAVAALAALADAVVEFKRWRDEASEGRSEAETHSLLREYVLGGDSDELRRAHAVLAGALNDLSAGLGGLAEHLDALPARGIRRIRRTLSVLHADLEEALGGVTAWLPEREGAPAFPPESFHDVETRPGGGDVLVARVLLPHEFLGRHYYPELFGAVFLSATTWLRGGFATAETYLGLARAAAPAPGEDRAPARVRSFRAPEAFDYRRVLVCAPRDAPPIHADKVGFLDYVARFTGYLAERTRGRLLALFTNADDLRRAGLALAGFFAARSIPFWYQRMDGTAKEELGELFRSHVDSVLFGLDTFWYGADFPGPTLEYLVIVRLPYGVPDRYHHAQCAALGPGDQRQQIYLPRALAKFRQGFGRLMRKETDRGCVFLLDARVTDPRHRMFLRELPLAGREDEDGAAEAGGSTLVRGDTDRCLRAAFAHLELSADIERRDLAVPFAGWCLDVAAGEEIRGNPPARGGEGVPS
ncbi:MAG: helicase C-terminal domain-containing protein [Planctomycetota bacterium]